MAAYKMPSVSPSSIQIQMGTSTPSKICGSVTNFSNIPICTYIEAKFYEYFVRATFFFFYSTSMLNWNYTNMSRLQRCRPLCTYMNTEYVCVSHHKHIFFPTRIKWVYRDAFNEIEQLSPKLNYLFSSSFGFVVYSKNFCYTIERKAEVGVEGAR